MPRAKVLKSATPRKRSIIAWRRPFRHWALKSPTPICLSRRPKVRRSPVILRPLSLPNSLAQPRERRAGVHQRLRRSSVRSRGSESQLAGDSPSGRREQSGPREQQDKGDEIPATRGPRQCFKQKRRPPVQAGAPVPSSVRNIVVRTNLADVGNSRHRSHSCLGRNEVAHRRQGRDSRSGSSDHSNS